MTRRLPPLNALRAFEAAARHLSFTRAADELYVTQAAVSHHIKSLEETLGVRLFHRKNRRLVLTRAGQGYLPALRDAFDMVAVATRRLRQDNGSGQIRVSTLQSFATKWLIPRLNRFHERHPDIDPMISTSQRLIDLAEEEIDVAIRVGLGNYPDLNVVPLMDDLAFPVCSPRLVEGPTPLHQPSDLANHVLLHDFSVSRDGDAPNWHSWLKRAGVAGIDAAKGPSYNDTAMALQAAAAGQGIALARRSLATDDLNAGLLVRPFDLDMPTRFSWYFVCTSQTSELPKVQAFLRWLQDEIVCTATEAKWQVSNHHLTRPPSDSAEY